MSTLTIRKVDETVKARLRIRAAHHGRSMEAEAREILQSAVEREEAPAENLAESIQRRFSRLGGVRPTLPQRDAPRRPPKFGK